MRNIREHSSEIRSYAYVYMRAHMHKHAQHSRASLRDMVVLDGVYCVHVKREYVRVFGVHLLCG